MSQSPSPSSSSSSSISPSTWIDLKVNNKYEICTEYPHSIRNKKTQRILKESRTNDGYLIVSTLQKTKHQLVATQWIPNPNNYNEVHHINDDRDDNRIDNLEWISHSENLRRRAPYTRRPFEFIDSLPSTAVPIEEYKGFKYDRYWFDPVSQQLIMLTKNNRYKIVHPSKSKPGSMLVTLSTANGGSRTVGYQKLIRICNECTTSSDECEAESDT